MFHYKVVTFMSILIVGALVLTSLQYPVESHLPYGEAGEIASPGDWITEAQLHVQEDGLFIQADGVRVSRFANTNSMDPLLDEGANGIEVEPEEGRLQVGDVVSYKSGNHVFVHRIVEIGQDSDGTYYIMKGDNNQFEDAGKVRFGQIQGVVIGVLY